MNRKEALESALDLVVDALENPNIGRDMPPEWRNFLLKKRDRIVEAINSGLWTEFNANDKKYALGPLVYSARDYPPLAQCEPGSVARDTYRAIGAIRADIAATEQREADLLRRHTDLLRRHKEQLRLLL